MPRCKRRRVHSLKCVEVGSPIVGARINNIEVDGDPMFFAAGYHGLVIVNVLDPTTRWIEGVVEFSGYAQYIAVQGRYGSGAVSGFGARGGF